MKIWVDADACPRGAKDLVYRAAQRERIEVTLVANQAMRIPDDTLIQLVIVEKGFDIADETIINQVQAGDLVITADIPLAAQVVDRGGLALDPRGIVYDDENVKTKLAARNLMASLRDEGLISGGPAPYQGADRHRFASALNRIIQQRK
ncbi:MAG: YaiI/YqxD family protein [Acidobacteria bacterium]|nr:YaiI/YqxD family protein [Acidobacteriota bacterium]